jgi:hypothetical protein
VLALQRSAGNAAVTDLVTRRGARGIHRAPLPDKDNEAIVARLHEAMAGWGTDEEAIFVSLQKLNKDAAAIAKVKELYKKTASSELEGDIRDEMSGTELALACELLGVGGKAVGATPGNDAEILAVVKRLHSAMDQWGTDEEAIYAALIPFNRDPAKVEKLKKAYTDEFKGGLTGKGPRGGHPRRDELRRARLRPLPDERSPAAHRRCQRRAEQAGHRGPRRQGRRRRRLGAHRRRLRPVGGRRHKGGFSVGYEGGLAADTGWVQFIWAEIVSTGADGTDTQLGLKGLPASNGTMDLTTDPDSPNYEVDSSTKDSPFYEDGGRNIRTATGTTLYDRPMEFSAEIKAQFDAGATKVVERDHFDQYLVQDYKTVYHTSVVVEWTYTSKTSSTKKSKGGGTGKITAMPSEPRKQLIAEYPKFDYIQ